MTNTTTKTTKHAAQVSATATSAEQPTTPETVFDAPPPTAQATAQPRPSNNTGKIVGLTASLIMTAALCFTAGYTVGHGSQTAANSPGGGMMSQQGGPGEMMPGANNATGMMNTTSANGGTSQTAQPPTPPTQNGQAQTQSSAQSQLN